MATTTVAKSYSSTTSFAKNQLYWPTQVTSKLDMLKIDIVRFVPISKSGLVTNTSTSASPTSTSSGTSSTTASSPTFNVESLSNVQGQNTAEYLNTVLLPIPEGVTYSDQPQWSEEQIGAMGKLAGSLAKSAAGGNAEEVGRQLSALAQAGMGPYVLQQIEKFGGPSAQAITQGAGGVILNPYTEQIFKGIGMRNFSFQWKLVPRNSAEQYRIHQIIKALRYYSLPDYTKSSGIAEQDAQGKTNETFAGLSDRWLTVPNIFKLKWVYQSPETEIQSLPKIKPCVLKNITVNYTPDGVWASHITNGAQLPGPAPVAYNLQLEFSETEIVTSSDVLANSGQGY